jgi:hypothetical protein
VDRVFAYQDGIPSGEQLRVVFFRLIAVDRPGDQLRSPRQALIEIVLFAFVRT